jgi:hypothetical protein
MATVRLPEPLTHLSRDDVMAFQRRLYHEHDIEVPFMFWQNQWHLRVSCQVYNRAEEYERLGETVGRLAK